MDKADKRQSTYQAYMLRLWRESPHAPWRASLTPTAAEHVYHFSTTKALFDFIERQIAGQDTDAELRIEN